VEENASQTRPGNQLTAAAIRRKRIRLEADDPPTPPDQVADFIERGSRA
jgi:hypothetical protein